MGSNFSLKYNVDIAMCMDATGSMNSLLDKVKANALSFYSDLTTAMAQKGKHIDALRVRVIAFRDYLADGDEAMLVTDFFNLPEEAPEFEQLVQSIVPKGGGDDPEDGLEALAYAIKSKWTTTGNKRRQIIIVWSDDATHPLGFCAQAPNYPNKMARDFDELTRWWGDASNQGSMDPSAKRLLIYAPDRQYWNTISSCWDNVLHFPSVAGRGLEEIEYSEILNAIANSI